MKHKYNLSRIMHRAHEIRRRYSYGGLSAVWSLCLSMAWDEAKNPLAAPAGEAATFEEFAQRVQYQARALSGEELYRWVSACVYKASTRSNPISFQDMEEVTQEAICKFLENTSSIQKLERTYNRCPVNLGVLVYRAAACALAWFRNQQGHFDDAREHIIEDGDGKQSGELEFVSSSQNMEDEVILDLDTAAAVNALPADVLAVYHMMVKGMTEQDMADRLGITKSSVHRRAVKVREALAGVVA